jgi:hypothetical protein
MMEQVELDNGVYPGRHTAEFPPGTVVFLIGMRINSFRQLRHWLPVFLAMPKMLAELRRHPELGLLGVRQWFGWRLVTVQQYWRSMDDLMTYAQAADKEHLPAWKAFNHRSHGNPSTGIWHEAYVVDPATSHLVYVNMPVFGMAEATTHVPAGMKYLRGKDGSATSSTTTA